MNRVENKETERDRRIPLQPGIFRLADLANPLRYATVSAVHRAFERGTLPVKVGWDGARYFVLARDLEKFLTDGIPQEQPKIIRWKPRNPKGGIGRPKKAQSLGSKAPRGGHHE